MLLNRPQRPPFLHVKNSTYTETFVQLRDKILSYGRDKKKIEAEGERIISGHFSNLQQGFSYVPFPFRGMNHILFPNLFSSFKVFLAHVRMAPSSRNFAKIREESHNFVPFFFLKKKKVVQIQKQIILTLMKIDKVAKLFYHATQSVNGQR